MSNWTESGYDPSLHGYKKGWNDSDPKGGYPSNYFFADTLRSIVIGFGQFFNDIHVIHYDEHGEPVKKIQVPIKFGPRSKAFDFRKEQESGKKYYIQLPNITYRIDSLSWAGDRYTGAMESRGFYDKFFEKHGIDYQMQEKFWADVQPVPYNITISMEAKTEYIADANQILEQILVRFAPDCYFDLKEFWFANIRRSIKMKCDSSNIEMNMDYGEEDKREITVSFSFTIEAFLYNAIQKTSIIDKIITKLKVDNTNLSHKTEMFGNFNGSFNDRYNFEQILGTKVGYISAVSAIHTNALPSGQIGTVTTYEYEKTNDIKNYPYTKSLTAHYYSPETSGYVDEYIEDNVLLTAVSSVYDSTYSAWNNFSGVIPLSGFGNNNSKYDFYTKPVDMTVEHIEHAPYICTKR